MDQCAQWSGNAQARGWFIGDLLLKICDLDATVSSDYGAKQGIKLAVDHVAH
jgi:hypothetical protein